jgi:hypothetical protein
VYVEPRLDDVAHRWRQEWLQMSRPVVLPAPPQRELPPQTLETAGAFDPKAWTCSVCGKLRLRELLHSKAILGRQQLVCAPSCLGAERRASGR